MTKDFLERFGKHIAELRSKHHLTLDSFMQKLREESGFSDEDCHYPRTRQLLNDIEAGARQTVQSDFIRDVAKVFNQNEHWLMCLAGKPPSQVLEKLVAQPEKYLYPLLDDPIRIGIPKILQAAHVVSATQQKGFVDFDVTLYDRGRDALGALIKDDVKFCVTTTSARQFLLDNKANQGQKIIELVELKAPHQAGIYYLYATDVQESPRRLAYLGYSIGKDLADGYPKAMKEKVKFVQADALTDVVEMIYRREISGFIGWPPQDIEVMYHLAMKSGVAFIPQEFRLQSQNLDQVMRHKNLKRNLVLMTTDKVIDQRPTLLVELIDNLIKAAAVWIEKNKPPETIKAILCTVPELSYLSGKWWKPERHSREEQHKQNCFDELNVHLTRLTFNITIREEAFPYLTGRQK